MVPARRRVGFRADQIDQTRRRWPARRRRGQARARLGTGAMGPLSPGSVERGPEWPGDLDRFRCGLVCGGERRYAGPAGNRTRQAGIRGGRQHDGRGDRAHGRQGHAERDRRPPGFDGYTGRDGRYGAAARSGRQRLGQRRLCRRHASAAARCKGGAHARPSHRRAVVFDQSQGAHACARNALAGSVAAQQRAAYPGEGRRPRPRRGSTDRRCRGRCRHSQPDQLQAASAGRLLPRSAPAHRRYPRPLRATDRRHARRTRPDQDRRRRRRRRAAGLAAHAKAARALFRQSSPSSPTAPPRFFSTYPILPAPRG